MDKKKICFITAIPGTATAFLSAHMSALSQHYAVHYVCNSPEGAVAGLQYDEFKHVGIERGVSIGKDLKAVFQLYKYCKAQKFDVVHSVTPKAGLLTALAGWMAHVPNRIHIFTGQVWATRKGFMRWLLKMLDKLTVLLDTHILVDGRSQRAFLEKEGVLKKGQATVFGEGSICGVDIHRFEPKAEVRKQIRQQIGAEDDMLVFLFMGRLNHDKGIGELYAAFDKLASETDNVFLLLIGDDEQDYISKLGQFPNIKKTNFYYFEETHVPEKILNAGDVFVLPSYREGFGTSVLEAASMGMPAITSDAYGVLDAIVEGETGLRCKCGDVSALYGCMKFFYEHPDAVATMGAKSRERVSRDFSGERLTGYWEEFYHSLLDD
ncbi:MAG: glycosyltransferase family 4 protein [Bacteroidales bacterium]|nr:glycosyltransferase family 4 protein [Bacteroidales bacterium]